MSIFLLLACSNHLETISQKEQFIVHRSNDGFPLNEEFNFEFSLYDMNNEPITPDEVLVDAEMPAHGHGMGQVPSVSNTDNLYTATGMLFAMEGDWDIHIYITEEGSVDQATYSIVCCE